MGRSRKEIRVGGRPKGVAERTESESHLKPASAKAAQSQPWEAGAPHGPSPRDRK